MERGIHAPRALVIGMPCAKIELLTPLLDSIVTKSSVLSEDFHIHVHGHAVGLRHREEHRRKET